MSPDIQGVGFVFGGLEEFVFAIVADQAPRSGVVSRYYVESVAKSFSGANNRGSALIQGIDPLAHGVQESLRALSGNGLLREQGAFYTLDGAREAHHLDWYKE